MSNKFIDCFFNRQFISFLLVGLANTLVGTGLMFLLYNLCNCSYWFSSCMNYCVGGIVSYILNKRFTFKNYSRDKKIIVKFIFTIFICYFISYKISAFVIDFLLSSLSNKLKGNIAMFVGMCLYVILNFLGQKFFAFKKGKNDFEKNS